MNLKTRLRSTAIRHFSTADYLQKQRDRARKRRVRQGKPAIVHYFHQVDDPYSQLAVQKLNSLKARYDLPFQPHLTSAATTNYQGSPEHFTQWAWRDAQAIAPDYGTRFTPTIDRPLPSNVALANRALATHLDQEDFADTAFEIGEALWADQPIDPVSKKEISSIAGDRAVESGDALRDQLGHYQGAMFYFDGEWFWGVDRMRLLEARLSDEGFDSATGPVYVPEPKANPMRSDTKQGKATTGILLEYFPSLRSPYTAIGHRRVLELIERTGVAVKVQPVMPMLMRGIPAPRKKQQYIITDAGREGRHFGTPLGRVVDPFGEPVKRAFALFPGAQTQGRGLEYVTAYLQAAWFDGTDITRESGLRQVAEQAGLEWDALTDERRTQNWQTVLEDNLGILTAESLWGVPSFRVSGGSLESTYACWGQDRIWRVESEIARRAQA